MDYARLTAKLADHMGPVIMAEMENTETVEVMLNPDGRLWADRFGDGMVEIGQLTRVQADNIMRTIASALNTIANSDQPVLEGELPGSGARFEGLLPPIVDRPSFAIRKRASRVFTLSDYHDSGIMSCDQYHYLIDAISQRHNLLVVGGTGSGKTTLANAVIDGIASLTPHHRLVVIEDTAELQVSVPNAVILRASRTTTMQDLLRATMRLRPDRIIVGEVRGGEALTLLKAWNTGHPGGIATVHAGSAARGLTRLEQLISEASTAPQRPLIAEAVQDLVFIEKNQGRRQVAEIVSVDGMAGGDYHITQKIPGE